MSGPEGSAPFAAPYAPLKSPAIPKIPNWLLLAMGAAVMLLLSLSAIAGNLSFRLSLTGPQLSVFNQGDSSAFYPAVFRMLADGSWRRLEATGPVAELAAGARLQLAWPDTKSIEQSSEVERMQPVMVRFFDQAGVGFGQISFFRAPPAAGTGAKVRYADGALQIERPDGAPPVRASWVLWAQEEGIRPIRLPVRFEHQPPPALRIDWQRQGGVPFRLDTGAGLPAAILIHESEKGYALQQVPGGGLQGREQRAAWLDATPKFYAAALIALGIAVGAMVLQWLVQFLRRNRNRATAGRAEADGSARAETTIAGAATGDTPGRALADGARAGRPRKGRAKTRRAKA